MTMAGEGAIAPLYTPDLLALTLLLADYPLEGDWPLAAEARSRTCGSTLALGLVLGEDGRVERIGVRSSACAFGQASAALFARSAVGRDAQALLGGEAMFRDWLDGGGDAFPSSWPGFELLAPARSKLARHGSMLLPFDAARAALTGH